MFVLEFAAPEFEHKIQTELQTKIFSITIASSYIIFPHRNFIRNISKLITQANKKKQENSDFV